MSTRRVLISGNWKMNHHHYDAIAFVEKFRSLLVDEVYERIDVTVHPPFTDLRTVQTLIDADSLKFGLGAQHCHWEDRGAFTGEVSPIFLAKLRVGYVICGHSERRELFGETDEMVASKVAAIIKAEMTPIMCVGETLAEREAGTTTEKVVGQVSAGLAGRSKDQVGAMVIAYEPIWAIGTGRTATPDDAQEVCAVIRAAVDQAFGGATAAQIRIQYGGSVKADNIAELVAQPDIDGALVGGASLDPDEFARLCANAASRS
jgi:triosephosphate isomerase